MDIREYCDGLSMIFWLKRKVFYSMKVIRKLFRQENIIIFMVTILCLNETFIFYLNLDRLINI